MEQTVLIENPVSEIHNVKGMAQKNIAEKVSHQKLQRQIDKQKRAFVKQHSRDENELKLILQRLQQEQQLHDAEVEDLSSDEGVEELKENASDNSEDEGVVNPYPVMILPKFGVTSPKQDKQKNKGSKVSSRFFRRKSLEYEDVDKIKAASSGVRTTLLAASFISKLRSPFHKKETDSNIINENWCEQWETTSSIRRPRKTVAEQNQHKLLQRAKSDFLSRPSSGFSMFVPTANSVKLSETSRHGTRKDDVIPVTDFHCEGTVEDENFSPRGISKSRRGSSLKEKKVVPNDNDAAKMRRCNSTKERRKKTHKDNHSSETVSVDRPKPLSRKNSKESKSLRTKAGDGSQASLSLTEQDSNNKDTEQCASINDKEPLCAKSSEEDKAAKTRFKDKHNRHGSLKERGEEKKSKIGGKKRFTGFQKVIESAVANSKTLKRQKSLSTNSSPINSPTSSPTSTDKTFVF